MALASRHQEVARYLPKVAVLASIACLLSAADSSELIIKPGSIPSFEQAIANMQLLRDFEFGTAGGRNIHNIAELADHFCVYGVAGTTIITREWQIYAGGPDSHCGTFNNTNWVFTPDSLQLTAVLKGPLKSGNITSGQITTIETFCPDAARHLCRADSWKKKAYAFEMDLQFPSKAGAWPGFWLYAKDPNLESNCGSKNECSEIDMLEVLVEGGDSPNEDQHYAGFHSHGPPGKHPAAIGKPIYNLLDPYDLYNDGTDWSLAHHKYQAVWTAHFRYTFLDGKLLQALPFEWYAYGPAQVIANLAFGSDQVHGLIPQSADEFPAVMDIRSLKIWGN